MNKLKLFTENFLIYGMGGIISKIIPLLMIPIVIRLMPDSSYYGINDLSTTIVQFGSAIAVMGMYDAMYRMFFEKGDEEYKRSICSTALIFTTVMSIAVFILMVLCRNVIAKLFFRDKKYAYVVYLSAMSVLVGATNSIISAPTRMQNKRKVFLAANTITPLLSYLVSFPLLLRGYYVIAIPLAGLISSFVMEISFWILNYRWFKLHTFDRKLLKQLLIIGVPLLPNFLIYWIFNSCDKLMITSIIGVGAAGVYSIGSKLGHASQLIYTAFAGGWQFFAFSTMKEENQVKSNSLIFEYLSIISFVASAFICAFSYSIFRILFTEEYMSGYIIAPYLFLAPLLQMLFQIVSNQFLVIKKTWPNFLILSIGAIVNIIVNYFFIPILGIEGASIATLLGYAVSVIVCCIALLKLDLMVLRKKYVFAVCIMIFFMIIWRMYASSNTIGGLSLALVESSILSLLYKDDLKKIFKNV